jgi:hypothetical protein|tara:strand:+ start:225 stop:422 length:198 start_codon:yes stop_codon:yes gene_type:complete
MSDVRAAVDQLVNGQHNDYKESVSNILMNKLKDRIDTERYNVGQSMFDGPADHNAIDQEEFADEV